jgi:phospholipase C
MAGLGAILKSLFIDIGKQLFPGAAASHTPEFHLIQGTAMRFGLLRVLFALFLSALLLPFIACGGLSSTAQPTQPAAPSLTFTANATSVASGQSVTLTWATTNATSFTITPSISANALPVSGSQQVTLTANTTYKAVATGAGGSTQQSVTITVTSPPPTITFSASPTSIAAGGSSTLSWTTTNATSVSINNGVGTALATSGTASVSPAATTTYTATATGPSGGTATATASVTVPTGTGPTITLTASPTSIAPGGTSTLTWVTTGAVSVTITGVSGTLSANGSTTVTPAASTTYTATAVNGTGNTATSSATVAVVTSTGGISQIKHIIYMVEENRSLDSYFGMLGAYKQSEGWTGSFNGVPLSASLPDYKNTGYVSPFHYQTVCTDNISPAWNESHYAMHGGKMDFFMKTEGSLPSVDDPQGTRMMGYYDQSDLPFYYELASQYATSDAWFSPLLSDTLPNRMYLLTATSFGHIRPSDVPPAGGWPQPTFFRDLATHGVSWRYYYQDSSVYLASFSDWNTYQGDVYNLSHYYTDIQNPSTLPEVIFIERAGKTGLDEHPSNNVQKGANDVSNIINAFLQSPAYANSVFILTWDEGGGLYDHVPPFAEPAPDAIPPMLEPGDLTGTFAMSGFRVGVIVISPWTQPHFVSHVNRDYTAMLKFIETRFNLPPLTARDAAQDDMTEFFNFSSVQIPTPPPLPAQPTNGACNHALEKAPGY